VVVDKTVYLRLGPRAAGRIEKNATAPRFTVKVAGASYPARYEKAPDMKAAVAAAMREKYWTDVLGEPFRRLGLTSETMTLRVLPED